MATQVPALIQLSDPRVAVQLVVIIVMGYTKTAWGTLGQQCLTLPQPKMSAMNAITQYGLATQGKYYIDFVE